MAVMAILLLLIGGSLAGAFGALLGLGGGVLIVPLLTIGFGLGFREAVAVSLLAVITTSSASAAVYLERRVADLRLGMTLELATALGGVAGALVAFALSEQLLAAIFALLLTITAASMARRAFSERRKMRPVEAGPGDAPAPVGEPKEPRDDGLVGVRNLPLGLVLSGFAGVVSAVLGVGGGIVKVPAMHIVMGVPLRVAAATSNLMMGVTASAGAVLYVLRGSVDPYVAGPVLAGVFLGASAASRLAGRVPVGTIRLLFIVVLLYIALEMAFRATGGSLFGAAR